MVAIKTFCLAMATALFLVLSVPVHGAEVKALDDLEKTILTDAIHDRCLRYQEASLALQKSLDDLNSGEEISSIYRINRALAQVAEGEKQIARTSAELSELANYVAVNKEKLVAGGLDGFLPLTRLNDDPYRRYEGAVKAYLTAFKAMLEYSKANISALRVGRKAEMDTHEGLYGQYVAATDRQGEAYSQWSGFLFQFLQENPLLRPHLEKNHDKEEKL